MFINFYSKFKFFLGDRNTIFCFCRFIEFVFIFQLFVSYLIFFYLFNVIFEYKNDWNKNAWICRNQILLNKFLTSCSAAYNMTVDAQILFFLNCSHQKQIPGWYRGTDQIEKCVSLRLFYTLRKSFRESKSPLVPYTVNKQI